MEIPKNNNQVLITRVYNNGDMNQRIIPLKDADDALAYDKVMRFGCALFKNDECVHVGYLTVERCIDIRKKLKTTKEQ